MGRKTNHIAKNAAVDAIEFEAGLQRRRRAQRVGCILSQARLPLLAIIALLLLSLPTAAGAIAIAPATIEIDFAPYLEKALEIHVINNDAKPADINLYVKGGLASYIVLPTKTLSLKPNEETIITAKIRLPAQMPEDGYGKIGAAVSIGGAGQIGAVAAVESSISLNGAAPQQTPSSRAETKPQARVELLGISITNAPQGRLLDIAVANKGSEGVEVYAEAKVESNAGKGTTKTDTELVPALGTKTLSAPLTGVLAKANEYKADVVLYYAGDSLEKSVKISGGVVTEVPRRTNTDFILIAVIAAIVAIDAVVLLWRRISNRKL